MPLAPLFFDIIFPSLLQLSISLFDKLDDVLQTIPPAEVPPIIFALLWQLINFAPVTAIPAAKLSFEVIFPVTVILQ